MNETSEYTTRMDQIYPENPEKTKRFCEKKRRNDTNKLLNDIQSLVYTSNPAGLSSKKVGKIQVLEKSCSFIRFYRKLLKGIEDNNVCESSIPSNALQDIFIYSQRGFAMVVDSTSQVICCSSSTMGFLQRRDTEIVGSKLPYILTTNDSKFIMSLIRERKNENIAFLVHFKTNSPDVLLTFICRAFWHQFPVSEIVQKSEKFNEGPGAIIITCSNIDKLSMYDLPIFYTENTLNFEFKISLDVNFMKIDESMAKYTGYSLSELVGRCLFDYVNWEQMAELVETIKASLSKGKDNSHRLQFCCKSKSWIWIQANIQVLHNVWNSRIDALLFTCKALSYNDVISVLSGPSQAIIEENLTKKV